MIRLDAFLFHDFHHRTAMCDVAFILRGLKPTVAIAIQRRDNPGASITNAAEQLWPTVAATWENMAPAEAGPARELVTIEHYPFEIGDKCRSTLEGDFD